MGPREAARLRPAMGLGDQSACFRRSRNEERSDLRLGCHELRPREKRKDRRANNSFKPTPFRCVACVRSLRSHTSPHRSRRGLTQALCGGHKELLCAGKALLNLVPNVDSAESLARPVLDLGLRSLGAEQFAGPTVSRFCVGCSLHSCPRRRKIASTAPAHLLQLAHNNSLKPTPLRGAA